MAEGMSLHINIGWRNLGGIGMKVQNKAIFVGDDIPGTKRDESVTIKNQQNK